MSLLMTANKASIITLVKDNPNSTYKDFKQECRFRCCISEQGFNEIKEYTIKNREKAIEQLSSLLNELEMTEKNLLY